MTVEFEALTKEELLEFSAGGCVRITKAMHYTSAGDSNTLDWGGRYERQCTESEALALSHYEESKYAVPTIDFRGRDVLIIGSSIPWIEMYAAARGARSVCTIEYRKIIWDNCPIASWKQVENDSEEKFDVAMSYSSLEHSGLGRYGDDIYPNADIEAFYMAFSKVVSGGLLYFAMPVGLDCVKFNRHRVYGVNRLSLLASSVGLTLGDFELLMPGKEYATLSSSLLSSIVDQFGPDNQLLMRVRV